VLPWAGGHTLGREISAWATYGRLVETIEGKDAIPELQDPPLDVDAETIAKIGEIAHVRSETIKSTNETFTSGDFWPGNLLIRLRTDQDGTQAQLERVYVVDWELAKASLGGMDVGQFCGDLRVLVQFLPELNVVVKPLIGAFVHAYADSKGGGIAVENWAGIAATHVGAHLVGWGPRIMTYPERRTRDLVRNIVERGIHCLKEGYAINGDAWTADRLMKLATDL